MGKGDKRTKRGKIFKGSHGKTRPAGKAKKKTVAAKGKKKA
jgi:30S ribosomal protein S31